MIFYFDNLIFQLYFFNAETMRRLCEGTKWHAWA